MVAYAFEQIKTPNMPSKPRTAGITSILDKGLGTMLVDDLCQVAGPWIDVVKFGWATARIQPEDVVRAKLARYHEAGIRTCTGGTFMEIAYAQNKMDYFLTTASSLGFGMVEISNGIHPMQEHEKLELIRQARQAGFLVWSEVGRKDPLEDSLLTINDRLRAIEHELEAGSSKVIVEARESGRVGIYDADGVPSLEMVDRLVEAFGIDQLVFEAPLKHQQVWLIQTLGILVNLGNIATQDAVSVATLRLGLRGDTFAETHLGHQDVFLDVGFNGAVHARQRGGVVVLIDALRASATIITALSMGMKAIKPVIRVEECVGEVTAGERGGRKLPQVDHGNSPTELLQHDYSGKTLVLTSSNGIECLLTAAGPETTLLVGTTLNSEAVADAALRLAQANGTPITLLMAGRNNRPAVEDSIAAGQILRAMKSGVRIHGASPQMSDTLVSDFMASESGSNLIDLGYTRDVQFCAEMDRYTTVPILRDGMLFPLSKVNDL